MKEVIIGGKTVSRLEIIVSPFDCNLLGKKWRQTIGETNISLRAEFCYIAQMVRDTKGIG